MSLESTDVALDGQDIVLRVDGPAIGTTYPLHEINIILEHYLSILDQTYLVLAKREKMSKGERQRFFVRASFPSPGSYMQHLGVFYQAADLVLAFYPILSSSTVWQTAKHAFQFLKLIATLQKEGKAYQVTAPNNQGIIVVSPQGSAPINFTQNVTIIADRSEDHYRGLSARIESGQIDCMELSDSAKEGIRITRSEKDLFNPATRVDDQPRRLLGKIFDFNTQQRSGRIAIAPGQDLPARDYRFGLIGDQDYVPYVLAMTREAITLNCVFEVAVHTSGSRSVSRLLALSVSD